MNDVATLLGPVLLRTTLYLTAAALATAAALRLSRAASPTVHRAGWLLTLLVGWSLARLPMIVPWYEAPAPQVANAAPPLPSLDGPPAVLAKDPSPFQREGRERVAAEWPLEQPDSAVVEADNEFATLAAPPPIARDVATSPTTAARPATWALSAWAAGAVLLVLVWLLGYVRFVRRLPPGQAADDAWRDQWRAMLETAGVRRAIPLRVTCDLGPMLCRLPRGYELLVPAVLWRELDPPQRAAILRHELAHYQRGDVWKSLAARLLALPHWFNPCAWWAVRRFDEAAEWACDRAAAGDSPAAGYARALLRLGEAATRHAAYTPAARGRTLSKRIRRLLAQKSQEDSAMKKMLLAAAAVCLVATALVRVELVAREPAPAEPQAAEPPESKPAADPAEAPDAPPAVEAADKPAAAPPIDEPAATPTDEPSLAQLARQGYEAAAAAYATDTLSLDLVCDWLQEWIAEELRAPGDRQERLQACQEPLEKLRRLQARVKALHGAGARGGEAESLARVDFHVAAAERRIRAAEKDLPKDAAQSSRKSATRAGPAPGDEPGAEPATAKRVAPTNQERADEPNLARLTRRGYEAARAAYETDTLTLDLVCDWLQEWIAEELRAPGDRHERLRACQEPLDILRKLQAKVKALYEAGARGGEAESLARVDFHVAAAERRLAAYRSALEQTAKLYDDGPAANRRAPEEDQAGQGDTPQATVAAARAGYEVARESYDQGTITLEEVCNWSLRWLAAERQAARKRPTMTPTSAAEMDRQVRDAAREQATLIRAHIERLRELHAKVLALHRAKARGGEREKKALLEFYLADAQRLLAEAEPQEARAPDAPDTISVPGPPPKPAAAEKTDAASSEERRARPVVADDGSQLRYDGKTFGEWQQLLATELSPQRQTEAVHAMTAFARKGRGSAAAREISQLMRSYNTWTTDGSPEGQLNLAAWGAFREIPAADGVPALVAALKKGNDNERLFAARALPTYGAGAKEAVPALLEAMKDPSPHIRKMAASAISLIDASAAEFVAALRAAMSDEDPNVVANALGIAGGYSDAWHGVHVPPMRSLVPDIAKLLEHADERVADNAFQTLIRITGKRTLPLPIAIKWLEGENPQRQLMAVNWLARIGPDAAEAIPLLEKAAQSDVDGVKQAAEEALRKIRPAETPPPNGTK